MAERTGGKKVAKGVRFVGTSIQINFQVNKRRYFPTLPLPQNATGINAAQKIRANLIAKAKAGICIEADILEAEGKDPSEYAPEKPLFQDYAQKYLKVCTASYQSKKDYLGMLEEKWMPIFGLMPIDEITTLMLEDAIDDIGFKTNKTKNNNLIPLRGVFATAKKDKAISDNPMDDIDNGKVQEEEPDPFTYDEMIAIINWMDNNLVDEERVYFNYFKFAFWTGCRPSEIIALHKSAFDRFNKTVYINKSRVRGVEKKCTKTHTVRTIFLNENANDALNAQLGLSSDMHIFINPVTSEPFYNEKPFRIRFYRAIDALGIRKRRAYNTRHTYATLLLMGIPNKKGEYSGGVDLFFAANQMGHSPVMMVKKYAKWLHGAKSREQIERMNN